MLALHSLLLKFHIILGSFALLLFWLPMLSRKGGALHRNSGRYYSYLMNAVALSGLLMAALVWLDPIAVKGDGILVDGQVSARKLDFLMLFNLFLFLLSLLSWVTIRHATGSLLCKQNRDALKHWTYQAPVWLLAVLAPYAAWQGFQYQMPLVMVFAGISIVTSLRILAYLYTPTVAGNRWLIEHVGAMIGSGIAAYTAFFAFGGRTFFAELLTGHWIMIPWLLPSLMGIPASIWFKRRLSSTARV